MAAIEARRCLSQRSEALRDVLQHHGEQVERLTHRRFGQRALLRAAGRKRLHRRAQGAGRVFKLLRRLLHHRQCACHILAFGQCIARQLHQRARAKPFTEELRSQFRQLVRLVDHEGFRTRQDLAEPFLFQRQVGQQQVVIDHDQVRRLRTLSRLHHETFRPEGAFAAQAILGGAGDHWQQRRILRQCVNFSQITHVCASAPGDDALELPGLLATAERRFAARWRGKFQGTSFGLLQPVLAQVIGATLQQGGLQTDTQRVAHARQIAVVELVLQGLGARGNDRLASRQQRGDEIGECLAGASAGLGQQHVTLLEGARDGFGQALLREPRNESGDVVREHAALSQSGAAVDGELGHLRNGSGRRPCRP